MVRAAAILHDIGIHEAERKHGSSSGRLQELEGPPIARAILEASNVDLADELTGMIEAQRGFTANSKSFQTGADLLDVVVNLKR